MQCRAVQGSAVGLAVVQAALSFVPYDPADPMVLEVSVVRKDAIWSLWKASAAESQHRPLGFCSRLFYMNDMSFKKPFLPCFWALTEIKCLTLRFQVTMHLELPVMSRVLIPMVIWRHQATSLRRKKKIISSLSYGSFSPIFRV